MSGLAEIGDSWAGYTVLEALGHLGMAERYRVRGKDGQLRLLDVVAMQHPQLINRLQAADLQRVQHPNLLAVHEVVPVLRFPAVVCADTEGIPLPQWLKSNPSVQDRLTVARGLASALAALHAEGMEHGYLQPSIVMVEHQPDGPFARLSLPGVASVVFAILREGGTVTTSGGTFGGVGFQSPEQQREPSRADARSDLFSLGCLLYYLLAGSSPFHKMDLLTCYEVSRAESYRPLPEAVGSGLVLPDGVAELVHALLHADPADRPPASAVADRLEQLRGSRRLHWIWWLLVTLGLLSVTVAMALYWP
jgi:serine/threonine protein kinase